MQRSSTSKLQYFQFDPSDWCDILVMDDRTAGKRFKEMVLRLSKFEAPEGTIEAKMISVVLDYSEKQRQKVMARWNRQEAEPPPQPGPPEPAPPRPPQFRNANRPKRKEPPSVEDVYDFCDANGIPAPFGREWLEYQESKGWNTLRMAWQSALRGFCKKKMND